MKKRTDIVKREHEVLRREPKDKSLELLSVVAQNLVQPFTEAQKVSETEATKRHEISVRANSKVIYGAFGIGVLILGLAYVALFKDNSSLAEKIVVAVISFLAGLGVGRTTSRPQK